MASSWDCASALGLQSGKVVAKSNHLVTLRRCEGGDDPWRTAQQRKHAPGSRFGQPKSGLDLCKRHFPKAGKYSRLMFSLLRHPTLGLTCSYAIGSIGQQQLQFHWCGGRVTNVAADVKTYFYKRHYGKDGDGFLDYAFVRADVMNFGKSVSQC